MPDAAYDPLAPPAVVMVPFCCERTRGMRRLSTTWVLIRVWLALMALTITLVLLPSHTLWNDNDYENDELWLQMVGWFDVILVVWTIATCRTLVLPCLGDSVQRWSHAHTWRPPTILLILTLDLVTLVLAGIFFGMEQLPPTQLPEWTLRWLWIEFYLRLASLTWPTLVCVFQWYLA